MAAITNQPGQSWRERLGLTWEGWTEHRSIRGLTVWILKLAAISATLLLFFAAVVIGISTTQPALIKPESDLMNFAGAAMSFGTDGALPGIFFLAIDAWQQGKRGRGGWLFFLVVSMLITAFISYCVAGQPGAVDFAHPLLVAKCMIALLYVMSVAHQVKQDGLNPTQIATLEARMQEQIAQSLATLAQAGSQQVAQIHQSVSSQVAQEVANFSMTIREEVAQNLATWTDRSSQQVAQNTTIPDGLLADQIGQLVTLVTDQAQTIQRLTNGLADVRREVRTTVTEIRSITQDVPTVAQIGAPVVDAESDPGDRVKAFLQQWSSPKKATLQQIMDACQVAKKTATRYREEFYGVATSSQNDSEE
jgi:hypothetical protein